MEDVHVVRHKVLVEGQSVRRVARDMGCSRNTVRRYVGGAEPGRRKPAAREEPERFKQARAAMDALLAESQQWTTKKQRLTAARLHELIQGEHPVSYTLVKEHVHEYVRRRREVFVPLLYAPGDLAEVDFFEVVVDVDGERQKAWMFVMRLMYSGRDFAWLYPRQDQVCFLDGHVRAFAHFGAVVRRTLADNLKAAVQRILVGSERALSPRYQALATHYVFEPCFARPYTGHDKGGVEGRGKGIRLQHLVPILRGSSLTDISEQLVEKLDLRAAEKEHEGKLIADRFVDDKSAMLPLPSFAFRPEETVFPSVSRSALAKVKGGLYSVPSRWAGLDITAHVGVDVVTFVGPDGSDTKRRVRSGEKNIDYRDYLSTLARKPQAVRQVALELTQQLGGPYPALWSRLCEEHGPKDGARVLARVLGVIVEDGVDVVAEKIVALLAGRGSLVDLFPKTAAPPPLAREALPERVRDIEVESARASDFDALLGGAP